MAFLATRTESCIMHIKNAQRQRALQELPVEERTSQQRGPHGQSLQMGRTCQGKGRSPAGGLGRVARENRNSRLNFVSKERETLI